MTTTLDPSTNGHGDDASVTPDEAPRTGPDSSLALLRQQPANTHILRGYGPLVVGAVLFVLMVILAPTVAPERVVEQPVGDPATTTTTVAPTTTVPGVAPTTTVVSAADGAAP
jgi:hypothetical protein